MPGELTVTQTMPPLPTEYERRTAMVPLDYETPPEPATPRLTKLMLLASAGRRLCLGAGVAFFAGGIIVLNVPRADEAAICVAIGLGLITAAAPLPKWWT